MKKLGLFILAVSILYCSCKTKKCNIEKIGTLYVTIGVHDHDTSYAHYVLLKGFSRDCIDSLTMVNIALKYIDSVKGNKPITVVMFYNSDDNFSSAKVPSSPDLEKNCLVKIGFNRKTNRPDDFLFYNDNGENIYWGNKWKKKR